MGDFSFKGFEPADSLCCPYDCRRSQATAQKMPLKEVYIHKLLILKFSEAAS